ncbi:MAG: DEAD/DEAH box helicase [Proteobacteria bacterium]|nr:DEAD/DEAH box helicase [Pseudomonadota bacterium]
MSFSDLNLSASLLQAIDEQGYSTPSPIQLQAIPAVLAGKDVMAAAQTGTGKTAGFTLPILERLSTGPRAKPNQARTLIITPTRELAAQVNDSVTTYGRFLPLKSTVVFGGVKINPQMMRLRKGVDILVATPGRLLDLYNQNAVRFDQLEVLVLDEADRMLDMGFIHDIRKILALLPKQRQNLMFSATFSDDIRKLAKTIVHDPVEISVSPRNTTVETVKHWICPVDKKQKSALLTKLIKDNEWEQVLVFSRTKHGANRLTRQLEERGIKAAAIHGNKSQAARTKALANFKQGSLRVLVATDIAARGIDISQLPQVVNFDLPNVPEDYVHRIGRTGRAGKRGQAVSLVSADEIKQLTDIERLIKTVLERRLIDGFEPVHDLPASPRDFRPIKAKKPKKPNHHQAGEGRHGGKPSGRNANRHGQANNGNSRRKKTGSERKSVSKSSPWAKASAKRRSKARG